MLFLCSSVSYFLIPLPFSFFPFFFFNDTATTEIYTLSLHDALPIYAVWSAQGKGCAPGAVGVCVGGAGRDRKSTRLNSSHVEISYAVFCLKKKKKKKTIITEMKNNKHKEKATQHRTYQLLVSLDEDS